MRIGSGIALIAALIAAVLAAMLFMGQLNGLQGAPEPAAPSSDPLVTEVGESPVESAQEVVDALNDRLATDAQVDL